MKKLFTIIFTLSAALPITAQISDCNTGYQNRHFECLPASESEFYSKAMEQLFMTSCYGNNLDLMKKGGQKEQLDSAIFKTLMNQEKIDRRKYFTYGANGQLSEQTDHEMSFLPDGRSTKEAIQYDMTGREIHRQQSIWVDSTNQWENQLRLSSAYNANQLEEVVSEEWDIAGKNWQNKEKITLQNNSGKIVKIHYSWKAGLWHDSLKTENSFDANNNLLEETTFEWNTLTNQWDSFGVKKLYTYNASGDIETRTSYLFSPVFMKYEEQFRWEFEYTGGLRSKLISLKWDGISWSNYFKDSVVRDGNGIIQEIVWFNWINQWNFSQKAEYIYDMNTDLADIIYPKGEFNLFEDYQAAHKLVEVKNYMFMGGNWKELYRQSYYYSNYINSGLKDKPLVNIHVYPNPTSDYLVFDMGEVSGSAEVTVLDFTGKVISAHAVTSENNSINVKDLNGGVYFYQISGADIKAAGRFVVR